MIQLILYLSVEDFGVWTFESQLELDDVDETTTRRIVRLEQKVTLRDILIQYGRGLSLYTFCANGVSSRAVRRENIVVVC